MDINKERSGQVIINQIAGCNALLPNNKLPLITTLRNLARGNMGIFVGRLLIKTLEMAGTTGMEAEDIPRHYEGNPAPAVAPVCQRPFIYHSH